MMKHVKTLNTKNLQNTVKKAGAANARLPASQPARPAAQSGIRAASISKKGFVCVLILRGSVGKCRPPH